MRAATTRAAARERGGWADEFDRIRASPLARSATHSTARSSVATAPGSTSSPLAKTCAKAWRRRTRRSAAASVEGARGASTAHCAKRRRCGTRDSVARRSAAPRPCTTRIGGDGRGDGGGAGGRRRRRAIDDAEDGDGVRAGRVSVELCGREEQTRGATPQLTQPVLCRAERTDARASLHVHAAMLRILTKRERRRVGAAVAFGAEEIGTRSR